MPPRRPTAFEVSFPDEVDLPLETLEISRGNLNTSAARSSSPLKRKTTADESSDAQQRAAKHALRLEVAYYTPPRGPITEETEDYRAPGEDPNPERKPIRVLYNFCVFEPNDKNQLVSLDELETGEANRQFAAAGIVLLDDEDDEDYGQEDGADAVGDVEEIDRDYLRLNDVSLCPFDYFTNAPVFVETQFAIYELRGPLRRYKPFFKEFLASRGVARAIVMRAMVRPQERLKDFRIGAPEITSGDLREAIPYIREVLEENGDALLRNSPLIKELLTSIPNTDRRRRTRPRGRANPQRSFLGNPDLAVLKAENQSPTQVTPLIAQLAKGYFEETLQVVGPPPKDPTRAEIDTRKAVALRFLKQSIARIRTQEKRPYGHYVEEASIGGEVYKTGEFVNRPPILPVEVPSDAVLGDFFWFARIVYFNVDNKTAHLHWLEHGSQVTLQEMAHEQELFLTSLCEDQPIGFIGGKLSVVYSMDPPHRKDQYFIRRVYDEQGPSCTSLDQDRMNLIFRNSPPENCLSCWRTDIHNANAEPSISEKNAEVTYQGHKYHVHDFFLYNAPPVEGSQTPTGPAHIGYIQSIRKHQRGRAVPKIEFIKVGRIGDLRGIQQDENARARNLYPERHVFLTDEKAEVLVSELVRPIHVFSWDFFLDAAELKRWVDYSPYHFYCAYRLPSLATESWVQRVPVRKTMYICQFCPSDMYRREHREPEFDAQHAGKRYQCLDLFGGTGAFSQAFAEGSGGLLKPTHLIEISPSAARTSQKNAPNVVTYCQDANVLLRYFIKSKANHEVEIPCQLWDNKTPVPPPMEPGNVGAIFAGLPCQSHSGLNMFRKAEDRKSNLILTALSYVDFLRPDFFFLENVPGFLKYNLLAEQAGRHRGLARHGAGNYGAPQNRIRFFLVAARHGLPLPDMPQPTHDFEVTNQLRMQLPYNNKPRVAPIRTTRGTAAHGSISIEDATGDLPPWDWKHPDKKNASPNLKKLIDERRRKNVPVYACDHKKSHCGPEGVVAYKHEPRTSYQRQARERPTQDLQHYTRCLLPKTVERVVTIPLEAGADFRSLPDNLAEWQFFSPVSAVGRNRFRGGLYGRLDKSGYFPTTVTNMHPTAKQSKVLAPDCLRMVSVRELARSQGFPDWFCFVSVNDNVVTLHRQIGNAVPWQVSRALGRELRAALFEKWKRKPPPAEEDVEMQ
ncbi:Mitogen-activated protein kinase [Mycena venus]|uniref:DNA (cytosine-5-)-methyltransferase n=1 Tax=Mycena venus TaxID=2733690 RepID=A0A8H7CTI7_9AGAR|nr:Mitogen-activated protein kinase [Mycena venus]